MQFGRETDCGYCDGKGVMVFKKGKRLTNTQESAWEKQILIAIVLEIERDQILRLVATSRA